MRQWRNLLVNRLKAQDSCRKAGNHNGFAVRKPGVVLIPCFFLFGVDLGEGRMISYSLLRF